MSSDLKIEEVFKVTGVPTHTFVEPFEYARLALALRAPGRTVLVEGPSGIGKTTSVLKAINQTYLSVNYQILRCRNKDDAAIVPFLPDLDSPGTVIIDDFHVLSDDAKLIIADWIKILADEERENTKIVILGINKAGDSLIHRAPDLAGRIEPLRMEKNTDGKIRLLFKKG